MEFKIKNSLKPIPKVLRQEDGCPVYQKNSPYFKLIKILFLICSLVLFLAAQLSAAPTFPGETWAKVENPEELGYSIQRLEAVKKFAEERLKTAAVVVVVDGKILFEWGDVDRKFLTHSARKSFMSALYGNYVKKGLIDLDKTMKDLGIDDKPPLSEEEKMATIRHCLQARSGVFHEAAAESASMRAFKPKRYSKKPGEYWCYNNWDFNVLCTIFEQETGKKFFETLKEDIADPIQMEDFKVEDGMYMVRDMSIHPAYHFQMTARDMARFGLLMLHNGRWNGKEIIPSDWVEESTDYHSDASLYGTDGYGYMWWVAKDGSKYPHLPFVKLEEGAYSARGAYGQFMIIIPERDMVIVHRVNSFERDNRVSDGGFGLLVRMILDAGPEEIGPLPTLDSQQLETYVGKYELRPEVFVTVSRENSRLFIQRTGLTFKEEIIAASEAEFYALGNSVKIKFVKNEKGEVEKAIFYQLSRATQATKIE